MSGSRSLGSILALPLIWLIRGYQLFISPLTPPSCRYYPSCSTYAVTALRRYGPFKGTWLALRRLFRCHPWAAGGVDHVPPLPGQPPDGPRLLPDEPDDLETSSEPAHVRDVSETSTTPH